MRSVGADLRKLTHESTIAREKLHTPPDRLAGRVERIEPWLVGNDVRREKLCELHAGFFRARA
jgi:hypothetical protein